MSLTVPRRSTVRGDAGADRRSARRSRAPPGGTLASSARSVLRYQPPSCVRLSAKDVCGSSSARARASACSKYRRRGRSRGPPKAPRSRSDVPFGEAVARRPGRGPGRPESASARRRNRRGWPAPGPAPAGARPTVRSQRRGGGVHGAGEVLGGGARRKEGERLGARALPVLQRLRPRLALREMVGEIRDVRLRVRPRGAAPSSRRSRDGARGARAPAAPA